MSDLRGLMDRARREAPPGDDALHRLVDLRARRRRNGRLLSAAVALAVTGAMVAGGIAVLNHRGPSGELGDGNGTSGPATSVAAVGPNLVAGPGQFYYWSLSYVMKDGHADFEEWFAPDGSGRVKTSTTTDSFGVPPDSRWGPGKAPFGNEDLSGLSTDPAQLLAQLQGRSSPGGASPQPDVTPGPGQASDTGGLVRAITDLLGYAGPNVTPQLRAALYEVFRGLPTAEDLGHVTDPAGRPALAARITTEHTTQTLYVDPATHLFMDESWNSSDGGAPAPVTHLIVQSGGIVDSDSSTPGAHQEFFPSADHLPTG
ncbi:MAG: hypothetical protein ACJ77A_15745 [Actinomycetota bacterium]